MTEQAKLNQKQIDEFQKLIDELQALKGEIISIQGAQKQEIESLKVRASIAHTQQARLHFQAAIEYLNNISKGK